MIFITDELGKFEKNIIELAENVGFKECKTIEAIDLFCGISEKNDVLKEKDRYYAFIDILDMRGTMDVFVYVTAISKGVPRISLSADQFLVSGKNGMVIDDFSDIGRSLTYYLDSFENWNQALVECYELGQKYTTSVLLKKWRKVLNFSE